VNLCRAGAGCVASILVQSHVHLEIMGKIEAVETIAVGGRIRDIMLLRHRSGEGRWRKRKGIASIRVADGKTDM